MFKAEIRKEFSKIRLRYNPSEMVEFSEAISKSFFVNIELKEVQNIHVFLPMISKNEIDTRIIVNKLWDEHSHIQTITSKSDFNEITMESLLFDDQTHFEDDEWGIPTPVNVTTFPDDQIDLILVPMLAFDKKGMRVGYGKAFYDKFLLKCKPDIIKVGVSILDPVDEIQDVLEHDVPLSCCITPSEFYDFRQ
jgi:5-formyltetrahydrofolate cyclo-ligase